MPFSEPDEDDAPMQPGRLSWQGSEVSSVRADENEPSTLHIDFSAGWLARPADGGTEQGFIKPLRLTLLTAVTEGDARLTDCIGQISEGHVVLDQGPLLHDVALPWHAGTPLTLTLRFRLGGTLVVQAQAAHCVPDGQARFFASYAC